MEAVNEGCKFVAQARELILRFMSLEPRDRYGEEYINDARILLDTALEKLAV